MIWRHCQSWFSLSYFRARFRAIVFSMCNSPLQSPTCIRPSLPPKGYKTRLSCRFSIRTHYGSTLQPKLGAITSLQDSYLKTTSSRVTQQQNVVHAWFFLQDSNWVIYGGGYGLHQCIKGIIYPKNNYYKGINLLLE